MHSDKALAMVRQFVGAPADMPADQFAVAAKPEALILRRGLTDFVNAIDTACVRNNLCLKVEDGELVIDTFETSTHKALRDAKPTGFLKAMLDVAGL